MASNKATSENILNSNNFQVFLDSLMSSDNNGLSTFLANQVNDEVNDISAGAASRSNTKPKPKSGKNKKKGGVGGKGKRSGNNVLYIPSIHNGMPNTEVGVVVGSTDPTESSAYKNMLKNDLMKEVDETFAKLLLENKIPIINSGNVLSYIEIVSPELSNGGSEDLSNSALGDDLTNGVKPPKGPKGRNGKAPLHGKSLIEKPLENTLNVTSNELDNGALKKGKPKKH